MPVLPLLHPLRALVVSLGGTLLVAVALYVWWPLGVVLGLAVGLVVVASLGRQQVRAARAIEVHDLFGDPVARSGQTRALRPATVALAIEAAPSVSTPVLAPVAAGATPAAEPAAPVAVVPASVRSTSGPMPAVQDVREDLVRLKAELGDDYPDFARAARLVVSTQYASAARLQRDLQLPYSRARRLLADLETQHFVGPATGTLPRQVLLPKERLPEVEELLAAV